jgi:ParB-like chromosome segregation protein Spo0J
MMDTTKKYQVMPPLSGEEYQALKEDIAENGVLEPVVKDTDGNIIDGHHRVWAYEELLAEDRVAGGYPVVERSGMTDQEKRDLAWRLNMQRRHLNRAQKHEAIERKLKESPEWADNRIAKLLGVDGKTVRLARVMLEGRKEIAKLKKLVGTDGKEYPRELENKFKDMGLKPRAAKGLAQVAVTRERIEGPLRWAGAEVVEEHTEPREPGVIEQMQASPEGREAMAEINNEFDAEGVYLRMRNKIHDFALLIRHVAPEEAARREFAHHAADVARDAVMDRRRLRRIDQVEDAEAVRDWLGEYIQRLEEADARLQELGEDLGEDK